eukprot:241747-Chlamydomonas_euryale.AAC.3
MASSRTSRVQASTLARGMASSHIWGLQASTLAWGMASSQDGPPGSPNQSAAELLRDLTRRHNELH